MAELCESFIIVPSPNDTESLCLGLGRLNQELIGPIHKGPALNDILPKLKHASYITIIEAS